MNKGPFRRPACADVAGCYLPTLVAISHLISMCENLYQLIVLSVVRWNFDADADKSRIPPRIKRILSSLTGEFLQKHSMVHCVEHPEKF